MVGVNAQLDREFPEYATRPLKVDEAQKLLGPDEALVFILTNDKASYVFACAISGPTIGMKAS